MVSCCLICLFMRNRFISCHYLNIPWSQRYTHLSYLVGFSLLLCQPPPRTGVGPIGLSIHCGGASKVVRSLIAKCQTQDQKTLPLPPVQSLPFLHTSYGLACTKAKTRQIIQSPKKPTASLSRLRSHKCDGNDVQIILEQTVPFPTPPQGWHFLSGIGDISAQHAHTR